MQHKIIDIDDVVIRFAGDSGDGMQLTGTLFADSSALFGNEISTFPDYPAEIRAPQGTVSGVSGFQVHIDEDAFDEKGIQKAGFKTMNPIEELGIGDRNIIVSPITTLTKESLKDSGLDLKSIVRCKNMFTLGMCFFMFNKELDHTFAYLEKKFKKKPALIDTNKKVLKDGFNYASNIHAIANTYYVQPAKQEKGTYRNINGNQATAWGLLAASEKSGVPLFCGSYPITPATAILEELAIHKELKAKTLQCEDEIAGICTAIGAAYAGNFAVTTTSGPGLSLKSEALGLAMITELPLVLVDVQRSGPSTGIPTKTEQTDLNQALYGRNGECPIMVMAAHSPSDCFEKAFYAGKFAMEIPSMKDLPEIHPPFIKDASECGGKFSPFERDPETFVRRWAVPGTPGLEHRVGGLEKNPAGVISSDPQNHQMMVDLRAKKVAHAAVDIPPLKVVGDESGEVLIVGWGGTFGHLYTAVKEFHKQGKSVSLAHFDYINPLPLNTEEVFSKFKKIIVCELNSGQFADYLRAKHQKFNYYQLNKVQGQPFIVKDVVDAVNKLL